MEFHEHDDALNTKYVRRCNPYYYLITVKLFQWMKIEE